jgi:hypothetical protein
MKHYLLAGLLLAAVPALAQTAPVDAPFKGANTIVVHTSDSAAVAYKNIARILLDAGYTLDRADKELLFLNTKSKSAPRYNMMHIVRASIKPSGSGSDIQIKDAFTLPGAAAVSAIMAGESETQFRGGQSSTYMICWNEMYRLAALYPNGKLSYLQQP